MLTRIPRAHEAARYYEYLKGKIKRKSQPGEDPLYYEENLKTRREYSSNPHFIPKDIFEDVVNGDFTCALKKGKRGHSKKRRE